MHNLYYYPFLGYFISILAIALIVGEPVSWNDAIKSHRAIDHRRIDKRSTNCGCRILSQYVCNADDDANDGPPSSSPLTAMMPFSGFYSHFQCHWECKYTLELLLEAEMWQRLPFEWNRKTRMRMKFVRVNDANDLNLTSFRRDDGRFSFILPINWWMDIGIIFEDGFESTDEYVVHLACQNVQ